jgi:hypothetical protein
MPRSHNPALEQAESGLNGVRVNVTVNVDAIPMLDCLVLVRWHACTFQGERVGYEFVGHDYVNILAYALFDVCGQRSGLYVLSMEEAEIAAALPESDYWFLSFLASANAPSDLLAANVGFIYFDRACQFLKGLVLSHRVPDAVTEIPSRPVVDSQHPFKLVRRHALAGLAEQVSSKKPLSQRQVRIMEDRASRYGELIAA